MTKDLFGGVKLDDYSTQHKVDELAREIKVRERVYPRMVEKGKLNRATAHIRIQILRAVLRDYKRQAERGRTNGNEEKEQ